MFYLSIVKAPHVIIPIPAKTYTRLSHQLSAERKILVNFTSLALNNVLYLTGEYEYSKQSVPRQQDQAISDRPGKERISGRFRINQERLR